MNRTFSILVAVVAVIILIFSILILLVELSSADGLPPVNVRNVSSTFLDTEPPHAWIDVYAGLPEEVNGCPAGTPYAVMTIPRYPISQYVPRPKVYEDIDAMEICDIPDQYIESLVLLRGVTSLYLTTGEILAYPIVGEYDWGTYIDEVENEDLFLSSLWARERFYFPLTIR